METVKNHTDINQSKKLAEILPVESADLWWAERHEGRIVDNEYVVKETPVYYLSLTKPSENNWSLDTIKNIPCYSLATLLNILPKIHHLKPILDLEENSIQYSGIDIYIKANNPVDACYEVILKLHELKKL